MSPSSQQHCGSPCPKSKSTGKDLKMVNPFEAQKLNRTSQEKTKKENKKESMDQQGKNTKSEMLDSTDLTHNKDIAWHGNSVIRNVNEKHLRADEELKIRQELEMDIERDLEEEIKDGIYHLALRLHRLYQHRKERSNKGEITSKELETLSEVNISIKMEGGTKVEIKETRKDQALPQKLVRPPSSRSSENSKSLRFMSTKKEFNWMNSLRSDSGPVIMHKKIHGSQASLVNDDVRRRDRGTDCKRK